MSRGGARQGAGRPEGTGLFGEPTYAVRVPVSKREFMDKIRLKWVAEEKTRKTAEEKAASKKGSGKAAGKRQG